MPDSQILFFISLFFLFIPLSLFFISDSGYVLFYREASLWGRSLGLGVSLSGISYLVFRVFVFISRIRVSSYIDTNPYTYHHLYFLFLKVGGILKRLIFGLKYGQNSLLSVRAVINFYVFHLENLISLGSLYGYTWISPFVFSDHPFILSFSLIFLFQSL